MVSSEELANSPRLDHLTHNTEPLCLLIEANKFPLFCSSRLSNKPATRHILITPSIPPVASLTPSESISEEKIHCLLFLSSRNLKKS